MRQNSKVWMAEFYMPILKRIRNSITCIG